MDSAAAHRRGMTAKQPNRDGTTTRDVVLVVDGMSCRHCVRHVSACLRDVPGVQVVEADQVTCQVRLRGPFAPSDVLSALAGAGHPARVRDGGSTGLPGEAAQTPSLTPSLEEEER